MTQKIRLKDKTQVRHAGALRGLVCALLTCAAAASASDTVADAPSDDDRIVVYAAASLADALAETRQAFAPDGRPEIVFSFAGSAALARQILLGAPGDLYISASPEWADALAADGRVEPGRRVDLVGNALVLVAPSDGAAIDTAPSGREPDMPDLTAEFDLATHLGDGRLAVGLVEAVPAGIYAQQALRSLGLWEDVAARLAQTDNVRAALSLVALGAAPLGIVYATDARAEPRVTVLAQIPPELHAPIVYPMVDLSGRDSTAENAYFEFLASPVAAGIFARHGFTPIGSGR